MRTPQNNWYHKQVAMRDYYQELQKQYTVTQVTLENESFIERVVSLWGANRCKPITDPSILIPAINASLEVESQPQRSLYNPANGFFYVVNQLSDSVSVVNTIGQLVKTIRLGSTTLPGEKSPVGLAVNTNTKSLNFGQVAIVCSVSNELFLLELDYSFSSGISIGNRPMAIAFNPITDLFYVTNLVSGTLVQLNTSKTVSLVKPISGALALGINTTNGDIWVFDSLNQNIEIVASDGQLKGTINGLPSPTMDFEFHPITEQMHVAIGGLNQINIFNPTTFATLRKINIGNDPIEVVFNPNNNLMYVANRGDQNIARLTINNTIQDTLAISGFNRGLAISSQSDLIFLSNSADNTVFISGVQPAFEVSVNPEYYADREDFQHNPTLVKHVKIVASGESRINALQLIEQQVTGKEVCETLSLTNYQSPQNFCNVSEVFDMDGEIIDGHICWQFKIAPKQRVTVLIYHDQFQMYSTLPEKSRVATGVEMSKGLPKSWFKK